MNDVPQTYQSASGVSREPHVNDVPAEIGPNEPVRRSTLLNAITRLIGRETEIALLEQLLLDPATRLLSLTGTGGSGKTRLALQAAENGASAFPGGIVFVSLAPIASVELVVPTVARALGLREGSDDQLEQRVATALSGKRNLLLIDNFEHVIEAAQFVSWLLQMCPELVVLVTSRTRLRIQGEREHVVTPLSIAPPGGGSLFSEAATLFVERMRAAGAGEPLNDSERAAVEEICQRLDGLPLAVELAAAWTRVLRPPALLTRLEPLLPMLVGGNRDAPARQNTMRATIRWSYDLLTQDEQSLFRWLADFRGGFTLESVEAVVGEGSTALHGRVLDIIAGLVDKSLLEPVAAFGGEPRFTLLETLREFALECFDDAAEKAAIQERHTRHFVEVAQRLGPFLQWQQDTQGSIARLDEDQHNIQIALTWAFGHDRHGVFLDLVSALEPYWTLRGKLQEGSRWLEIALPNSKDAPLQKRANTIRACAWNARYRSDYQRADTLGRQALALAEQAGDHYGKMHALTVLGFSAHEQGNFAYATEIFQDVRTRAAALGDLSWVAWATRNIGRAAHELQDFDTAQVMNERAIALFHEAGCPYGATEAEAGMALLALERGEIAQAARHWRNRMEPNWDEPGLRTALEGLAELAAGQQFWEWAARLLGAAEAHRERLGVRTRPAAQARFNRILTTLRAALDPVVMQTAWDCGRGSSAREARMMVFAFVDTVTESPSLVVRRAPNEFGLTRREMDVLELVGANRTNRQIAEALFISVPTVKRHLTTAYTKLGVDSRAEAAVLLFDGGRGVQPSREGGIDP